MTEPTNPEQCLERGENGLFCDLERGHLQLPSEGGKNFISRHNFALALTAMSSEMPERIWVTHDKTCCGGCRDDQWLQTRKHANDVEYVRADIRHQPPAVPLDARADRLENALRAIQDRLSSQIHSKDRQWLSKYIDETIAAALTTTPAASGPLPHADRFESFKKLERGWDSYNAAPVDPRAIKIAEYLSPFLADWAVVLCSDGMIQFEKGWAEICIDTFDPTTDKLPTNAATGAQTCVLCGHSDGVDVNGQCKSQTCGMGCISDNHPCDCACEFPATTTAAEIGGEICKRCGQNVAETAITWWHAPDELWLRVEGSEAGIRCIPCFTKDCDEKGILIYWQAVEDSKPAATPSISAAERMRRALEKIVDGNVDCNCTHEDEFCCVRQKHYCPFCIAAVGLAS